ncbi:MAG: hypothetical protein R2867_16260 [Caldilineaceae bacterium]
MRLPYSADGHHFTAATHPARTAAFGYRYEYLGTGRCRLVIAWQRTTARVYAAAFHKRYSGFGSSGPDAIYQLDLNGTVTGVIELDTLLGIANSAGTDAHNFTPIVVALSTILGRATPAMMAWASGLLATVSSPATWRRFTWSISLTAKSMHWM